MTIYVITHKPFKKIAYEKIYTTLQVGAATNKSFFYLRDDQGDNISGLNPFYCELTGMYWIWKNTYCDIVGICHYRRYFIDKNKNILNETIIKQSLEKSDLIVPRISKFALSVYKQYVYGKYQHKEDIDKVGDIIREKYPQYFESFRKVMSDNKCYAFNMMVMKRSLFDKYCVWLFDILFSLQTQINYTDYKGEEKRVFGFISERLFLVWIRFNQLKVMEYDVLNTETLKQTFFQKVKNRVVIYLKIISNRKKGIF